MCMEIWNEFIGSYLDLLAIGAGLSHYKPVILLSS